MDAIDRDFVGLYKDIGDAFGVDSLILTIFARLYIEPGELSMEDLAKETGYSLASISNSVKALVSVGMIKRSRKPGSRKVYLYSEKDISQLLKEHLLKKEEYGIRAVKENLPKIIRKHKNKALKPRQKEKISILEGYHKQIVGYERILREIIEKIEGLQKND